MTARTWRWIGLTLSAATVAAGVGFGASIIVMANGVVPFRAPVWWGYALTAGALLSCLVGERFRAALLREWPHPGDCRCSRCLRLPWRQR